MKRKLPPDHEVAALREKGMTSREIAERYGCAYPAVDRAIRRHTGRPCPSEVAAIIKADPVWWMKEAPVPKLYHTSLRECGDLLRERGVEKGFA